VTVSRETAEGNHANILLDIYETVLAKRGHFWRVGVQAAWEAVMKAFL